MFAFRSKKGVSVSPSEWLTTWSCGFDATKFPEDVYQELVAMGMELSDADYEVLGAWKDGSLRHGSTKFGNCSVSFTDTWKENAVAAYTVWRTLPQRRSELAQYLRREEYSSFLSHIAKENYTKTGKKGLENARFGLSRATYVLHMFSHAAFPIYDANTQAGVHFLTQGLYDSRRIPKTKTKSTNTPDWYLGTFCRIIRDLQKECEALDIPSQRAVDKALFCYGKEFRKKR